MSEIRSKFLDLLLELEKKLPENADGSSLKVEEKEEVNQVITFVMKQINVMNTGDRAALNIGDGNDINSAHGTDIKQ
ncbi:hypothetical protein [Lewinella sp. LCG006]|uniref:hypothetical protein n=1 Tax=Lewinella sp. LCG006 TaxID=3231911 RepID=UPI00345F1917